MATRRLSIVLTWAVLLIPAGAGLAAEVWKPAGPFFGGPPRRLLREPPPPVYALPPRPASAANRGRAGWFVPDIDAGAAWLATPSPYDELIAEIADLYNLDRALVKAVVKAESNFDPAAISPKGALGLMQLMPQTAARHHVRRPFVPRDNVDGGCRELRFLLDRYAGNLPLALAAYNAGVERVEEAGGVPAITETRQYLARVLSYRAAYRRAGSL